MITHSMQQACDLGSRVIMMHQGEIVFEISGRERYMLTPADLIDRFHSLENAELSDAQMLGQTGSFSQRESDCPRADIKPEIASQDPPRPPRRVGNPPRPPVESATPLGPPVESGGMFVSRNKHDST